MNRFTAFVVRALNKKKESRVLLCILLSFVFCLSSLKIYVKADSDTMDIAYLFYGGMGFHAEVEYGCTVMKNSGQGTSLNTNSVYLYPTEGDPVHVVYYYISGQMYPTVVDSGNSQNNGLINANLINITFTGSTRFRLKYTSSATIMPVFVGNYSSMPDDVRALIQGETIENRLNYLISIENATKSKVDSIFTRLGDTNTNLNTINSSISSVDSSIGVTNSRLNNTNQILSNIQSYLYSNNQTTNNNVSNNNSSNINLNNNASDLALFEDSSGNDLDTNLNTLNIDPSTNGLLINSNFVNSALWVRNIFDRLIVSTPFELILIFSLSLGIALAMIGKIR